MSNFHVILPVFFAENDEDRREALNLALVALKEARHQGRAFVLSDGIRPLIVAIPGGPLMVPNRNGELVVAVEQDPRKLMRWLL